MKYTFRNFFIFERDDSVTALIINIKGFRYAYLHFPLEERTNINVRLFGKRVYIPLKVKQAYYTVKNGVKSIVQRLDRRTKYYVSSGTDCDGVYSTQRMKFKSAYEAEQFISKAYNWADGPLSFNPIDEETYDGFEAEWRDYGMEAYEDGHPHVRYR